MHWAGLLSAFAEDRIEATLYVAPVFLLAVLIGLWWLGARAKTMTRLYVITYKTVSDSVSVFAEHAHEYHAQRLRIVPCFDEFYGTAVGLLSLREGPIERVLDLGAGTGLMSQAVLAAHPGAEVVLLDGAAEMIEQARENLAGARAELRPRATCARSSPRALRRGRLRARDPPSRAPREPRAARAHRCDVLRPGGVFVNAEHVAGPTPWLQATYRRLWREACLAAGASEDEVHAAEGRMEMDRSSDVATQLGWMAEAGFEQSDCFFKALHFAVLAGWRPGPGVPAQG